MSSLFYFPDNRNEPTHSTQFSFDEYPNFISLPSFSAHTSNKSAQSNSSNDDVVDAMRCMEKGGSMIVFKLKMDNDKNNHNNNNNNIAIEWNLHHLDINHEYIESDEHKSDNQINICDIDKINKLDIDTASHISSMLNISGLQENGLQSVALRLIMKNCDNYFLIFDDYQRCFIWHRGLKTIKNMISINHPITTIAFCVSSVDRINNDEMHQKMKINNDDLSTAIKWIKQIKSKLCQIQKHILHCHQFAQSFCILDSTEHLSLLLQTKSLNEMYFDANKLASIPYHQLSKNEITLLRELWLSILADLTVAILKKHQLKNDINTSKKYIISNHLQISL